MRKVPAKNYLLLLLLLVVTFCIVVFARDMYESRTKKQYTSIMNSFITEIKIDDLTDYTLENSPVVIYMSDKTNIELENDEQKYKELLTDYNIQNYFVYLDTSNQVDDIITLFEKKYDIDINENELPNLVVIIDGKVVDIYSEKTFNKELIVEFLEKNEVIERD